MKKLVPDLVEPTLELEPLKKHELDLESASCRNWFQTLEPTPELEPLKKHELDLKSAFCCNWFHTLE
jgi:hypothetical protein